MNYTLSSALYALPQYGSILVSGADASSYLQGQLSFDMERLTTQRVELASCNSAQGRVQAVLWMIARDDGIALVLPAELIEATVARLRKYMLRSKVKIESTQGRFLVCGADTGASSEERLHIQQGLRSLVSWPGESRTLVLVPSSESHIPDDQFAQQWHAADIRAGLPQVYSQTRESFVAQMLNIDLLGGVSFEKGCYTGQEIIARTHFRGTVKRRMLRFAASCAAPQPGTRVLSAGAHAGDVVDAVPTPSGCELLAVISLAHREAALELDGISESRLTELTLPYPVD